MKNSCVKGKRLEKQNSPRLHAARDGASAKESCVAGQMFLQREQGRMGEWKRNSKWIRNTTK